MTGTRLQGRPRFFGFTIATMAASTVLGGLLCGAEMAWRFGDPWHVCLVCQEFDGLGGLILYAAPMAEISAPPLAWIFFREL